MGLLGGLGMLLFWGLIIGLIVWLVVALTRSAQGGSGHNVQPDSALEILRRRLAAGEITPLDLTLAATIWYSNHHACYCI